MFKGFNLINATGSKLVFIIKNAIHSSDMDFHPVSETKFINLAVYIIKRNMYTVDYLNDFTRAVFIKMGCREADAVKIAEVFMAAELRGLPSHGMIRIKDYYQLWKANRINVKPEVKIVYETPSTAVVDGDGAVGMVAATRSMEIAIEKAKVAGTGWVSTRNSNHYGIAGFYAMMALKQDMIGMSMTNANPLVAPTFSVNLCLVPIPLPLPYLRANNLRLWLILPQHLLPEASWPLLRKKAKKFLSDLYRIKPVHHRMIRPF